MPEEEKMSIATMLDGGAVELIDIGIQEILDNIADVNTTLKRRELIIKIGIVPTEDRGLGAVDIEPITKLAGQGKHEFLVDLRRDGKGRQYARERNRQQPLPMNVTPIKKGDETP